jgi:hypothetical protein
MHRLLIIFSLTVLSLTLSFCTEDPEDNLNPAGLTVDLLSVDKETKTIELQANAENTVRYDLHLNESDVALLSSTDGYFVFSVDDFGTYTASVRAYGSSGKYLSVDKTVEVNDPATNDPVPLDHGYFSPESYDGYEMVWSDEFTGNSLNTSDWTYEIGDGCPGNCGWGNNELEYYRAENTEVGDDVLTITAKMQSFGGKQYTSSRLITKDKQSFQYGRVDIRALLPRGQGIWPALWMLGSNISSVGWPQCGEIDIMEMVGGTNGDNTVHGTLHWDVGGHAYQGGSTTLSEGIFADEYHVFSIVWDQNWIRWYLNNDQYYSMSISGADMTEFQQDFFFIFNVAVGGNWPGSPDHTTVFPQQMKVDYIRVFQKN